MARLNVKAAHVAALAGLLVAGLGVSAALADPGNGNGPPPSPPGQGECQHGNSGQDCRSDPQAGHGKDCDEHGNHGGVNEDHCLGATTTETTTTEQTVTSATTTHETTTTETSTTVKTPTNETTTTVTNEASTQETTTPPVTTTNTPAPDTTTSGTPSGAFTPPAVSPSIAETTPARPVTKTQLEKALAEQATRAAAAPVSHRESRAGELPFTGFPTWIIVLVGSLMTTTGLGIRRLTR